jgi:OFA family oxalate/formate antiporter-like MFS transporter
MTAASTDIVSRVCDASAMPAMRWRQLALSIAAMVLIANLQYSWTLFVSPINQAHGWSIASIQLAFSIFIALETWLTPAAGWIVDTLGARRGPKIMVAVGGVMVALGWTVNARAESLQTLYLGAVLAGSGGGAVYAACLGQAVKWFPDRRGFAVGLAAAGYGAGAALTVVPIRAAIDAAGYQAAFFWFGLIQGGIIFVLAWLLRGPDSGELIAEARPKIARTTRNYAPWQVLAKPAFWILYLMFVIVTASGLMVTAQLAQIAKDFGVANVVVLLGATTLSAALIIDNICNGAARPLFGWISDHIGREHTMAIAFGLGGAAYWLLGNLSQQPWAFVLFAALIFLTWGEIFSLFPSTCTDTFGTEYATVNLSLLYTAKGAAAFLVPLANVVKSSAAGWQIVFDAVAFMNIVVVGLALLVLKPLRHRLLMKDGLLVKG